MQLNFFVTSQFLTSILQAHHLLTSKMSKCSTFFGVLPEFVVVINTGLAVVEVIMESHRRG